MKRRLSASEINHLRRLLGWVRCDIGQTPDEMVETVRKIADVIHDCSDEGKQRLVEAHQRAARVPKYVRDAVKALEKILADDGSIVDVKSVTVREANRVAEKGLRQLRKLT